MSAYGTMRTMYSRDYAIGYLAGLADSDASIHYTTPPTAIITFSQLDRERLKFCQELLSSLEIDSKLYGPYDAGGKRPISRLRINRRAEVEKFIEVVGFRHFERAERARRLMAGEPLYEMDGKYKRRD